MDDGLAFVVSQVSTSRPGHPRAGGELTKSKSKNRVCGEWRECYPTLAAKTKTPRGWGTRIWWIFKGKLNYWLMGVTRRRFSLWPVTRTGAPAGRGSGGLLGL